MLFFILKAIISLLKNTLLFIVFLLLYQSGLAQRKTAKQIKAYEYGLEAVTLMDNGLIKQSLKLLDKSKRLDPKNYKYEYERGYAYYLGGDLDKAISIFQNVLTYDLISDKCHYMLGQFYTERGDTTLALQTLEEGLLQFPRSGKIRNALGQLSTDSERALQFFREGIESEPSFASNYYYACKALQNTSNQLDCALYGEIFMNYERNTERTKEISQIIFNAYAKSIDISDTSFVILNFGHYVMRELPGVIDSIDLPFETAAMYIMLETLDTVFLRQIPSINVGTITKIKTEFIREWHYNRFDDVYNKPLFALQKRMLDLGLLESYNHWLFMGANTDAFEAWAERNRSAFGAFARWYSEHELDLREGMRPIRNRSVNLRVGEL